MPAARQAKNQALSGSRQPDQYASELGLFQIPGHPGADRRTGGSYSRERYAVMTAQSSTYRAWKQLSGRPGGSRLFSLAAVARVP
jgi:hypothetical protein